MILCCGEALIDMIPTQGEAGAEAYMPRSGGAVLNTAVALGRLGAPVGMFTGLSNDLFGQQLANHLHDSQVDTTHIVQSNRPTTLAFVKLVQGQATYLFYDENSAGRMLTKSDLPVVAEDVSALFFGGISLACEPAADSYADLLVREANAKVVMLDPNIRPKFIADEARYRTRLELMIARTDIIKVSDDDLDWIDPQAAPLDQKVANLLAKGPSLVILTRGGEGATGFHCSGAIVPVAAQKTTVVDTVGAGDTYNAGVLAKLLELGVMSKDALRELPTDILRAALEHGAKAAAVTVSRAGANPPWKNEL